MNKNPKARCPRCGGWLLLERYGGREAWYSCLLCGWTGQAPQDAPISACSAILGASRSK